MIWKAIADLVAIIHVLWMVIVLIGPFWGLRNEKAKLYHTVLMWTGLFLFVGFDYCPITALESWLRLHYDPTQPYPGSFFVARLTEPFINTFTVLVLFVIWSAVWTFIYYFYRPIRKALNKSDQNNPENK